MTEFRKGVFNQGVISTRHEEKSLRLKAFPKEISPFGRDDGVHERSIQSKRHFDEAQGELKISGAKSHKLTTFPKETPPIVRVTEFRKGVFNQGVISTRHEEKSLRLKAFPKEISPFGRDDGVHERSIQSKRHFDEAQGELKISGAKSHKLTTFLKEISPFGRDDGVHERSIQSRRHFDEAQGELKISGAKSHKLTTFLKEISPFGRDDGVHERSIQSRRHFDEARGELKISGAKSHKLITFRKEISPFGRDDGVHEQRSLKRLLL
ncbi:MAG: hypothetical protein LC105_01355 [Chitinophagales bacterium]|nr:hypothetical protein [Chitinophagales bacterium]